MDFTKGKKYQIYLIALLVVLAYLLTYYFQNILKTGQLYTHFFYIPIILSCIWWKKKGLYVTLALILILVLSQNIYFKHKFVPDDFIRAFMLAFISIITVWLSEALTGAQQQLHVSETRYRTIFENAGTAMAIVEEDGTLSLVNSEFERLSGYTKAEIENKMTWKDFAAQEQTGMIDAYHQSLRRHPDRMLKKYEIKFIDRNKTSRDILLNVDMIPETSKSVASFSDITEFKETLKKQKELQAELSTALAKVLSGYIPICANCKKIRTGESNWTQLEAFLSEKTSAAFSHSICPQCARELYSEFLPKDVK